MKKIATSLIVLALCAVVAAPALAANSVRISQVYGGGGGSSAAYAYDYIELFNASGSPVDMSGWAVEYGSPTGLWGSSASNIVNIPAGTFIPACGYFLIQSGAAGTGSVLPVTPDIVQGSGPSIGQTNGKVALFTTANPSVACGAEVGLVDKVSYGTGNCPEGTAMVALTNASTAVRGGDGLTDSDNNSTDFSAVASLSVTIHNSGSATNPGCVVPVSPTTWGRIKTI